MTREQILKAYLEDELLVEKGHLEQGEGTKAKWNDLRDKRIADVIKFAIEGVMNGDSHTLMTRKINKFLDAN